MTTTSSTNGAGARDGELVPMRLVKLVEDTAFYPRDQVDDFLVGQYCEVLRAGRELPPIVADKRSLRIVDGYHRRRAHLRVHGNDDIEPVLLIDYPTEAELFLDALRRNAHHGKRLTSAEIVRSALRAEELGISRAVLAVELGKREDTLNAMIERKAASGPITRVVAVRPGLEHLAGTRLTYAQEQVNMRVGGYTPTFYARALIELIEADAIDIQNRVLMERLRQLHAALGAFLARCASAVGAS
jgi:hypothetical protein